MRIPRFVAYLFVMIFSISAQAETEKYRCMWKDDPSTSMVVAWNQASGKSPILYLDTIARKDVADFAWNFQVSKKKRYKRMNNHFVRLHDLKPDKVYYFIIKDSNSESQVMSVRTLPDSKEEQLSIIAGGDSRNHRKYRQNANLLVSKLRPHFVLFGGDMTGMDGARGWKGWLDDWQLTMGNDGRLTPIVVARGNHERNNDVLVHLFDVPNEKVYYAHDFLGGLLRIYTLNTMISLGGDQLRWLKKDLENHPDTKWKMAQYHHPIRPHTKKKSEGIYHQKLWAPVFYEHNMNVAIECDAHVVKTTYPIRPSSEEGNSEGFVRDDSKGTIYIGEGCWGAPLRPNDDDKPWTRASGMFNQFKWIHLDKNRIDIRTVKTDNAKEVGRLFDNGRFDFPDKINIWDPPTGSVVTITKRDENIGMSPPTKMMAVSPINDKPNYLIVILFFIPLLVFSVLPFQGKYVSYFREKLKL